MKKFISLLFVGVFGLFGAVQVQALDLGIGSAQKAAQSAGYDAANTSETTLAQNIGNVIRSVLTISGVIFTALLFYAGYLWMMARGDESQVQKSKDIIETSIVGLVIALASFGITTFVMNSIARQAVPAAPPQAVE